MGLVIDTGEGFWIEERSESVYLHEMDDAATEQGNLFAYRGPFTPGPAHRMSTLEVSKEYLRRLNRYLDAHPEVLEER